MQTLFKALLIPFSHLNEAFEKIGYSVCSDASVEGGFEKIAIYGIDSEWTHAARQLPNGGWTSKLGKSIDVEHTLDALESDVYGKVQCLMKRKTRI